MKRSCALLAAAVAITSTGVARADDAAEPRRLELGATLAYAAPVGAAERGARVSDTTYGAVPFRLDGAYALTSVVGLTAAVAYAPAIPTLCQSAGDCESSLGSDVAVSVGARFRLPRLGPTTPRLHVRAGYEWLTTRLSDAGVTSTRAYDGPLMALEADAPFRLGSRFTLGPVVGAALGVFAHDTLETPASRSSGAVPEPALHAWLTFGVRLGFGL